MNKLFVPLMFLIVTILVVSIFYIIVSTRHREKMSLIEKGMEPILFNRERYLLEVLKWGLFAFGLGLGFLSAFIIDHAVLPQMENTEPLYPALSGMVGGFALIFFYLLTSRKYKN